MEKKPCQQVEIPEHPTDPLSLTVEQFLVAVTQVVSDLIAVTSVGAQSIPMMSGDSPRRFAEMGAVLFWALRAMAALSQLQSWTAMNEYATILPVKRLLQSCTLGQQAVMEIYSSMLAAVTLADVLDIQPPADTSTDTD